MIFSCSVPAQIAMMTKRRMLEQTQPFFTNSSPIIMVDQQIYCFFHQTLASSLCLCESEAPGEDAQSRSLDALKLFLTQPQSNREFFQTKKRGQVCQAKKSAEGRSGVRGRLTHFRSSHWTTPRYSLRRSSDGRESACAAQPSLHGNKAAINGSSSSSSDLCCPAC